MRQEGCEKGAFRAESQNNNGGKNKKTRQNINKLRGSTINIKNSKSNDTQVFHHTLTIYIKQSSTLS